jgi:hypothetical protein
VIPFGCRRASSGQCLAQAIIVGLLDCEVARVYVEHMDVATVVIAEAATWPVVLAWLGVPVVVAGIVSIQLWTQRRRRRGEEASTYYAEGADAMLHPPGGPHGGY